VERIQEGLMLLPTDKDTLNKILELAKEGQKDAIEYLRREYSLKVFTYKELERINELRVKGLSTHQAIKEVADDTAKD
jgi:uncharacterized protein YoaH (UPF0181 family)